MLGELLARLRLRKRTSSKERPAPKWKYPTKWEPLDIEELEKRQLFAATPWLTQPPYLSAVAATFDQDPSLDPFGGRLLGPLAARGAHDGYLSNGTFTFHLSGGFSFTLHAHATVADSGGGLGIGGGLGGGGGEMILDEAGTATFTWDLTGTVDNGQYAVDGFSGLSFSETVNALYTYSWPGGSTAGTVSQTETTFHGDKGHWYVYNWVELIPNFSGPTPDPFSYAWDSFAANECGTLSDSYAESGSAVVTGTVNINPAGEYDGPPGGLPPLVQLPGLPSGDVTPSAYYGYDYRRTADYQYLNSGQGTFTLHEEGPLGTVSDVSLNSIAYDESGSDTYSVSQTGTGSITGSGYVNIGGPEGNGVTAGTWARADTFGYQENGTFGYSESGGYNYAAHDRGQAQGGHVALSSVLFNEDNGSANSWAFAATGTMTFTDTQTLDGGASGTAVNGEGFGYGSFSSATGLSSSDDRSAVYVGGGTFGASDTGSGSFSLHQAGTYSNGGTTTFGSDPGELGAFSIGSLVYSASGAQNNRYNSAASATFAGLGTTNYASSATGGGADAASGTSRAGTGSSLATGYSAYALSGSLTASESYAGAETFVLSAQGSSTNGSSSDYSFSSLVYTGTTTATVDNHLHSLESYSGLGTATTAGTGSGLDTTAYGGTSAAGSYAFSQNGLETYAFAGTATEVWDEGGGWTEASRLAGTYGGGVYAIGSVVRDDSPRPTYGYSYQAHESFSGSGSSSYGQSEGGGGTSVYGGQTVVGGSAYGESGAESYAYSGESTYSYQANASYTATEHREGAYADGFGYACYVKSETADQTVTYSGSTSITLSGGYASQGTITGGDAYSGTDAVRAVSGSSAQTVTYRESGSYAVKDTITSGGGAVDHFTRYSAGAYAAGSYSLSSISYSETGTASDSFSDLSLTTVTGSGADTASYSGPGAVAIADGNQSYSSLGSTSGSANDAYNFTSFESAVNSDGALVSWSRYGAGQYSGGSLSLSSVAYSDSAAESWGQASLGSLTASGSGHSSETSSGTFVGGVSLGGEVGASRGTTSFSAADDYAFNLSATWAYASVDTVSASISQAGVYNHGSFAFNSVALDEGSADSVSYSMRVLEHDTGSGASTYTSTGSTTSLGTYGTQNWGGGGSYSASGHDAYAYTADTTETLALSAADSYSFHAEGVWKSGDNEMGPLGPTPGGGGGRPKPTDGTWSYGTVVYTEQGNDSVTDSSAGSITTTGSGAHSSSEFSNNSSLDSMTFTTGTNSGSMTAASSDSYSFSDQNNYSITENASDSYHHYLGNGKYSAGSYSYGSVTLDDSSSDSLSLDLTDRLSFTGAESDSSSGSSSSGGTFADFESSNTGSSSYEFSDSSSGSVSSLGTTSISFRGSDSSSDHAEGVFSFGAYSYSSLVFSDSSNSAVTESYVGTLSLDGAGSNSSAQTTTGAGLGSNSLGSSTGGGNASAFNSSSYSMSLRSADSYTLVAVEADSQYEAGVYAGGSYALSSVALDSSGTTVYDETSSGTLMTDATEGFSTSGSGTSDQTMVLGSGGHDRTTGQGSYAYSGSDHAATTLVYSSENHSLDTASSHEAGVFANGSYAMSSVLFKDGGSYSYAEHDHEDDAFDGSGAATVSSLGTMSNFGSFSGGNTSGNGVSGSDSAYSYAYGGTTSFTYDGVPSGSYSDYQAGVWSQGSYSFSSLVHSEAGNARETFAVDQSETDEQTTVGSDSSNGSSALDNGAGVSLSDDDSSSSSGTYTYAGTETTSYSQTAQASYALFQAGTAAGECLSLTSVLYQSADNGSYSLSDQTDETWTGNGTQSSSGHETQTSGSDSGAARTADDSSFSYTLTATSSYSAAGSYSDADYRAGVWSGGSYAFTSAVHDESTHDSDASVSTSTYLYESTGTLVNVRSGISTAGVNGTFAISADGSTTSTESATSSSSDVLHEEGTFVDGSWSLSSVAWDTSANSTSGYVFSGYDEASDSSGFSLADGHTAQGNSSDSWSLHEAGSYAAGCWSLGSLVEQEHATSADYYDETWSQVATGQGASGTISSSALETFDLYRAGTYGGGSYSFGSLSLDDHATESDTSAESGHNADYSSYARSDTYDYKYDLHVAGGAQVGTYTEDSLETYAHAFDATLTGGGTQHDSSLTTIGYSNTGTVSLAAGELHFNGVDVSAPTFPVLPPEIDDPALPANGGPGGVGDPGPGTGGPAAPSGVGNGGSGGAGTGASGGGGDSGSGGKSNPFQGGGGGGGVQPGVGPHGPARPRDPNDGPIQVGAGGGGNGAPGGVQPGVGPHGPAQSRIPREFFQPISGIGGGNGAPGGVQPGVGPHGPARPRDPNDQLLQVSGTAPPDPPPGYVPPPANQRSWGRRLFDGIKDRILPDDEEFGRRTGMKDLADWLGRKSMDEKGNYVGVGQPGPLESLIPFWGSGRAALDDAQNRRWRSMVANSIFFALDAFLVGGLLRKAATKAGLMGARSAEEAAKAAKAAEAARAAEAAGKSGVKGCFAAGTLVSYEGGRKPIEQIIAGDRVWAFDFQRGKWRLCAVLETYRPRPKGRMVTVHVGEEEIRATDGHPFWVVRGADLAERGEMLRSSTYELSSVVPGRWVYAIDLRVGDELLLHTGETMPVAELEVADLNEEVYNFQIAELHNYAVGCSEVLVHNDNASIPSPGQGPIQPVEIEPGSRLPARGGPPGSPGAKRVPVDASRAPESAKHLQDTGVAGRPIQVNREGAAARRRDALRGKEKVPGHHLDESPPAALRKPGDPVSVRPVPGSDNTSAGAQFGNGMRGIPNGGWIIIDIINGTPY